MFILLLLSIVIHLTVGQISTLKSFDTFLEHASQINDISELGSLEKTVQMKEQGLYGPQEDKDESEQQTNLQTAPERNLSKEIPLEIYKGTDDDNAYFITFREVCDDKPLSEADKLGDDGQVTPGIKSIFPKSSLKKVPELEELYDLSRPQVYIDKDGALAVGNGQEVEELSRKAEMANSRFNRDGLTESHKSDSSALGKEASIIEDRVDLKKVPTAMENANRQPIQEDNIKLQQNELANFENYVRIRDDSPIEVLNSRVSQAAQRQDKVSSKLPNDDKLVNQEVSNTNQNDLSHHFKTIPKLKLVLNEHPESVEMKIDLNAIKNNDAAVKENSLKSKSPGVDHDGISVEEETMDDFANDDDAKNFLKDKITREIARKEEEIIERLENRPNPSVMEVAAAPELANLSYGSSARRPRAIEGIDKTITYSEHERTMKQEVEVTYKRAQDIARAILKTSEAVANSLDLCRKPISTNFISDEPLTETEDIIDQIVGQLKESLELTMGCRTCVKPHKDLMLFMRWLIFDDVSVKLCPSKPKAADLRRNYLLFNHDNMFIGRVCSPGEQPKAPFNCSATGEIKAPESVVSDTVGKPVAKKRSRINRRI